jgi:hypothetical protein
MKSRHLRANHNLMHCGISIMSTKLQSGPPTMSSRHADLSRMYPRVSISIAMAPRLK